MLKPQQTFNSRYQIQQPLGKTAPGKQTWLAIDLASPSQEKVVIKFLAFHPETQWEDIKLFERETQILQQLSHPNIPSYRDYFTIDADAGEGWPQLALVQDYIAGISLQDLVRTKNKLNAASVVYIAEQVLDILMYLHQLSPPVIHRDIKPSNLIYTEKERQVYLIDFGSVQDYAQTKGITLTIVGTQGYAPPEQLLGKVVPSSDIYSLGATLIYLLTGVEPAELAQRNCRILWSHGLPVSFQFIAWVNQLIDPVVETRFTTAKKALNALKKVKQNYYLSLPPAVDSDRDDRSFQNLSWGPLGLMLVVVFGLFMVIQAPNQSAKENIIESVAWRTNGEIDPGVKIIEYSILNMCNNYRIIIQFNSQQAEKFLKSYPDVEIVNYYTEDMQAEFWTERRGFFDIKIFERKTRRLYIKHREKCTFF